MGQFITSQLADCQTWQPEAMTRSMQGLGAFGGGAATNSLRHSLGEGRGGGGSSPVPNAASLTPNGKGRAGGGAGINKLASSKGVFVSSGYPSLKRREGSRKGREKERTREKEKEKGDKKERKGREKEREKEGKKGKQKEGGKGGRKREGKEKGRKRNPGTRCSFRGRFETAQQSRARRDPRGHLVQPPVP
ncbi:E3 ubiquitin-protein ligase BRE1A, partial [Ophiophagus hannah]